ncbi:MAG: hypothetical protein JAY82_02830 [Candidatus Thiodiazotropha taylori]|nr:hypothetical protein [Candidatus Thiodiazotropha taylori]
MPPLHHPVKILLPAEMEVPEAFILGEHSELICNTCHGVEKLKDIPLDQVDPSVENFLHYGPYGDLTDFCYHCHEEQGEQRYNLHVMLDSTGEIDDSGCTYCHTEIPDPSDDIPIEQMEFRLPKAKLCYGCHLKTPHLNTLTHLKEPDDAMKKRIASAETEQKIRLPLDDEGRVTCITCHTAHQSGVIDPQRAGGRSVEESSIEEGILYRRTAWSRLFADDKADRMSALKEEHQKQFVKPEYQRVEKEILIRLPAKDGSLCLSCHEFED